MAITESTHWRDAGRTARFFVMDARAAFPLVLCILHIRLWTILTALVCMGFFAMLERYGFSVPVFLRWVRCLLAGKQKIARPWWRD